MALLFSGVAGICALVSLICWILVVVAMFKHDKTALGILSIVLCGIGALIAFVFGWQQHKEWNLTKIMTAWTVAIVVGILMNVLTVLTAPSGGGTAVQANPPAGITAHV